VTNTKERAEDTCPLVYQYRLPLSTRTVNHLADLLRRRLKAIRSRWRILPPGKIAVIVLAVLRHDQRLADMAGGNNVSESTVRRWRDELINGGIGTPHLSGAPCGEHRGRTRAAP
jgi:transposase-like protein